MPRRRASSTDPAQIVSHVLNETLPGLQEHDTRVGRYDRAYQIWRGMPTRTVGGQRPWDSRLRIKYGMQVVDQTMVNVVQGAPKAVCTPRKPTDVEAAKAMEQILGYYADQDHLAESEPLVVQQALVYGVSPVKTMWLYREQDVPRRAPENNWQGGMVTVVQDDRPTMIPWDVYDCWWEPLARDPDRAAYVILREWPTRDELERRRLPDGVEARPGDVRLRNLDLLYQSGAGRQQNQTAQNQLLGYPSGGMYRNRYELWEVWRDNRLTIIGNRNVLLYDGPKPNWMPGKPVSIGNSRPDFLRIEGVSETELVDDLQQALHTHDNLVMENLKMSVMRGATVRETVPDMSQLVLRPNFFWPVTDHDDVQFQDPPPLSPDAYRQRDVLIGAMQYVTGINPSVTGNVGPGPMPGGDTATGVSSYAAAASKILEFKARLIALKVYQRVYEQWKDLTQQNLTRETSIQISSGEWREYGPQDIYGDYDVRVQAGEESLNRQQKRAESVAVANALAPYVQLFPSLIKPIIEQIATAYGWTDIDSVLAQAEQSPGVQQPAAAPMPFQNGNGQLLPQPSMATLAGNAR